MTTEMLKSKVTGIPSKDQNPIAVFSGFLDKFKPQMALCLPKHLTADRMARLSVTAFSTTPKLQSCDPKSIVASIMTASTLGLEIGVNGQGFLVPYGTRCQFIPGWKGLVELMNRSGKGTIFTGVIFKDQKYTYSDGAKRDLIVHNETDLEDPQDITHAYAIGWIKGSEMPVIELWRTSKLQKHRDRYNKVGSGHYSYKDWEMYARKIPLLQVLKYMPQSIELQNAVEISNASENGMGATIDGDFVTITDPEKEKNESEKTLDKKSNIALNLNTLKNRFNGAEDIDMLKADSHLIDLLNENDIDDAGECLAFNLDRLKEKS